MIPKQGKNPNNVSSYRPISLLPIIFKLLEKLLLTRIRSVQLQKNGYHRINLVLEKIIPLCSKYIE
jgi:hypothetical protein